MDRVLVIAGDSEIGEQLATLTSERGDEARVVFPTGEVGSPEGLFDAAFDYRASAVVLIEPIRRTGVSGGQDHAALRAAARRAAQSPFVRGFGWVTHDGADDAMDLQSIMKPFGVLRLPSIVGLRVDVPPGATKPVLIRTDAARRADEDGAMTIKEAALVVADWIERDAHREGAHTESRGQPDAVARAVGELGFEPLVLAPWRVGLNGLLGMFFVDSETAPWSIRRKSWLGSEKRSPVGALSVAG